MPGQETAGTGTGPGRPGQRREGEQLSKEPCWRRDMQELGFHLKCDGSGCPSDVGEGSDRMCMLRSPWT